MKKEQILEHIRNAPLLPSNNQWSDIADMYASALSAVSDRLTAMEMAEFVAVGMLARRHVLGDAAPAPESVLDYLQRGVQISLF
jgi:hypothetical protein